MKELSNYRDLLEYLNTLTEDQLSQPIQLITNLDAFSEDVIPLQEVFCIGTIQDLEYPKTRDTINNSHNLNGIVLLSDHNPFSLDGAIAYDMNEGTCKPIYSTPPARDWTK